MFDLEDEFIIESFRVPWLIWVQLVVMILLLIVLVFGFGIFALNISDNPNGINSASSSSLTNNGSHGKKPSLNGTNCANSFKVEGNESIRSETDPSTSEGLIEEDSLETDESSVQDIALFRLFGRQDHPCNYLGFAKQAFLKCLGLGYSSENHRKNKRGKKD